jgi:hypothetical protein
MEKFLRDWRQDALNKHQYDSAIFIGDKLLALTGSSPLPTSLRMHSNILQVTTKMPSGLPKSTFPLETTPERKVSSQNKISSPEILHVDISLDTA